MKLTCKHPDRDIAKLLCGYPLPCPWHTVTLDTTVEPPTMTIPITANAAWNAKTKLAEILEALT